MRPLVPRSCLLRCLLALTADQRLDCRYPVTLTLWHMFFSGALAFACVRGGYVQSINMSSESYMRAIVPIGALFAGEPRSCWQYAGRAALSPSPPAKELGSCLQCPTVGSVQAQLCKKAVRQLSLLAFSLTDSCEAGLQAPCGSAMQPTCTSRCHLSRC